MLLINCEINCDLNWSENCVILANDTHQDTKLSITDAKLYFPVVILSTQDNPTLLELLKSGFKRTINWNKYRPKVWLEGRNEYLDFLIDRNFQGANRVFVLSFENEAQRTSYKRSYLPTVEITNNNVMIQGQNFFDEPVRSNLIKYDNIQKITTGQGDDYATGCLLNYNYFKNSYKILAIDLSK